MSVGVRELKANLSEYLSRAASGEDLDAFALVALDPTTMNTAARIAEQTLCRSLDSIHLGAAQRAGTGTTLLTFDVRRARAARELGMPVLGG